MKKISNIKLLSGNRYRISYASNPTWGKGFTTWFKHLIAKLRVRGNDVEVNEINYNGEPIDFITLANANQKCSVIPKITDCDVVVENLNTLDISIVSFSEYFEYVIKDFMQSEFVKELYMAHCHYPTIHEVLTKYDKENDSYKKVKPFFALTGGTDQFYKLIGNYQNLWNSKTTIPRLFFAGSLDYRQAVNEIYSNHPEKIVEKDKFSYPDQYFKKMVSYRVGLSYFTDYEISYRYNEICFRDIEYAALGIPFIRIEYYLPLKNPLIPDYHYISIPREKAYYEYKNGGNKALSNLIVRRFDEVKDDYKYLDFISFNIKNWYENNASLESMTNKYIQDSLIF